MAAVAPHELAANSSVHSLRLDDSSVSSASETGRPVLSRRDTEHILDYYQSEDAGRAYVGPMDAYLQDGHTSPSHPDFSTRSARSAPQPQSVGKDANAGVGRSSMESVASSNSGVQRRTSQRSARGSDNRRIAIVETDLLYESQTSSLQQQRSYASTSSYRLASDRNLLTRRGMDSSRFKGLALVAPSDAHPSTYTDLSPVPSSAPATGVLPTNGPFKGDGSTSGHQRSMSDAQSSKKTGGSKASPRDVGIVGTLETMQGISPSGMRTASPLSEPSDRGRPSTSGYDHTDRSLPAPVFQTPKSRSPSPLPPSSEHHPPQATTGDQQLPAKSRTLGSGPQLTTKVTQEPEIDRFIAGPVVVDLTSGPPVFRRSPSVVPSGLPIMEPPVSESQPHGNRGTQRIAGRLPFKPNQTGPTYLHYQPGIHSTAGPLPSPPRHILTEVNTSPPPRPPRLLSPPPAASRRINMDQSKRPNKTYADEPKTPPIKPQESPLPITREDSDFSITAVSISSSGSDDKSPDASPKTPEENQPVRKPSGPREAHGKSQTVSSRSGSHVREGAFPASSVFLLRPSQPNEYLPQSQSHTLNETAKTAGEISGKEEHPVLSDIPSSGVVEGLHALKRSHSRPGLQREGSFVSVSAESVEGGLDETSPPSSYSSSREGSTHVSTTNVMSDDGHFDRRRASLPAPPPDAHKRFPSIPRTSSLLFVRSKSRTPPPPSLPVLSKKVPSPWPEAMNFHHILVKKSAAERAFTYAEKIRELASEESGLRDWLIFNARKERRRIQLSATAAIPSLPRGFVKQSRHVSRSSLASEVTFPIRADSYTATDLSLRPTTDTSSPSSPASVLPYPSLAHGVGIRNHNLILSDSSSRGIASSTSSPRTLGGAFFASLGRKTSIRKDRTLSPTSPVKLTSARQTAPIPQPRPVKIAAPPTIPGGPRAPPRRVNSVIPVPASVESFHVETQVSSMSPRSPAESSGIFDLQVQRLSDLLPQAEKDVLAIYLRRAKNHDPMLAIGAYLEDEKQDSLLRE